MRVNTDGQHFALPSISEQDLPDIWAQLPPVPPFVVALARPDAKLSQTRGAGGKLHLGWILKRSFCMLVYNDAPVEDK